MVETFHGTKLLSSWKWAAPGFRRPTARLRPDQSRPYVLQRRLKGLLAVGDDMPADLNSAQKIHSPKFALTRPSDADAARGPDEMNLHR